MRDIERSLPAALAAAAARHPDRVIGVFDRRGRTPETRTHAEVLRSARRTAERMAGLGVGEGDRVIVCLPTSWEWFDAWLGTLLRGAIPVAMAPAVAGAPAGERIAEAVSLVGARLVVGGRELEGGPSAERERLYGAAALTPEELESAPAAKGLREPAPEPGALAFLQFTSGSTGRPRAVMIPHRAALHQAYAQDEVVGAPWGVPSRERFDALVSWLPLYHDMGLLGIFYSILNGRDLWLLPPQAFLARPRSWLEAAGSRGTTVTAAPNFGYQLCTERLDSEQAEGLDLAGFQAALTGAEMVRADTIDAFSERFAAHGFSRESFRPCYGLAEATLAVTLDRGGGPRAVPVPGGADAGLGLDRLVSNGEPIPGTELQITAPDGSVLPPGELGEVRIKGPSVFLGYYDDPEATAETLVDGWLRAGDLGFVDRGELFIAGRLKEILIVRGQNLMPHEFERLAESATGGGGAARAAAFSVARGPEGEEVILVVELARSDAPGLAEIAAAVRSRIGRELALPVADVALVRRGRIPRTTSGKVKRDEARRLYLDGELQRLG